MMVYYWSNDSINLITGMYTGREVDNYANVNYVDLDQEMVIYGRYCGYQIQYHPKVLLTDPSGVVQYK